MGVAAAPRPPARKGLPKLVIAIVAVGLLVLALIGLALWTLAPKDSSEPTISAAEYTVLAREDVTTSVRVTGTVQPHNVLPPYRVKSAALK